MQISRDEKESEHDDECQKQRVLNFFRSSFLSFSLLLITLSIENALCRYCSSRSSAATPMLVGVGKPGLGDLPLFLSFLLDTDKYKVLVLPWPLPSDFLFCLGLLLYCTRLSSRPPFILLYQNVFARRPGPATLSFALPSLFNSLLFYFFLRSI